MVEDTLIDPVSIIKLIAELLPGPIPPEAETGTNDQSPGNDSATAGSREEEAGCMLWDLAAMENAATVMAVSQY